MQRINTVTKAIDLFGAGKHGYKPGNPATNDPATTMSADALNALQEEIASVIEGAGLDTNATNNAQMLEAINLLIKLQMSGYVLDTGVANSYVAALTPAITAYTDGMQILLKIAHTNTGASTIDAGGGVVPLTNNLGSPFAAGDLQVGSVIEVVYVAAATKFYVTSMVASQTLSQAVADGRYAALVDRMLPGTVFEFAGAAAPSGTLIIPTAPTTASRTAYAALFAAIGTAWGVGDGVTTFGLPYCPADYAFVQANANVGTSTVGQNLAHAHTLPNVLGGAGSAFGSAVVGSFAGAQTVTGSNGGTANLAAGVRVLKCIKY